MCGVKRSEERTVYYCIVVKMGRGWGSGTRGTRTVPPTMHHNTHIVRFVKNPGAGVTGMSQNRGPKIERRTRKSAIQDRYPRPVTCIMCHPSWVHSPRAHGTSTEFGSKFVVDLTKTYREICDVPPCCREVTNKQRMAQNEYHGVGQRSQRTTVG